MSSNDATKRAEFIAGLRAFADLVESDPTIPTPSTGIAGTDVYAHIHSIKGVPQDERFELVHDFADTHQVPVTEDYAGNRRADKTFGPVNFHVRAYADDKPAPHIVTRPSAANRIRQPEPATL